MKQKRPVIEGSGEVADMYHLRLMPLLQELERGRGRKKAAALFKQTGWTAGRWTRAWMRGCCRGACGERWTRLFKQAWAPQPPSRGTATTSCRAGWTPWRP